MTPDNQPSFISRFNPITRDESPFFAIVRTTEFIGLEIVSVLAAGPWVNTVGCLALPALFLYAGYQFGGLEKFHNDPLPPWQKWRKK